MKGPAKTFKLSVKVEQVSLCQHSTVCRFSWQVGGAGDSDVKMLGEVDLKADQESVPLNGAIVNGHEEKQFR
jgi:hypothetical protein